MPGSVNVPFALWLKRGEKGNSLARDFDSLASHFNHSWSRMGTQNDQHIHEPLPVCKTSVFISLWSTAKGPEKKAISSQPWIEYFSLCYSPSHLWACRAGYTCTSQWKMKFSNMPNAFRHLFADVLEKLCVAFRRCPTNTCSRYTTPCLKSLHTGPLPLIAFLCISVFKKSLSI